MQRGRRTYLDWLRGIAVLLMIEAHVVDAWTAAESRVTDGYYKAMIAGGMGSVLFLVLAGVAVALSAGSKYRRSGDAAAASNAVVRRGLEIFALAFLFRLQAWILGWSSDVRHLLRVDILNIMGPSIAAAAVLWRFGRTPRARLAILGSATVIVGLITPVVRALPLTMLPEVVRAYFVSVPNLSSFVFFPSMAFVFGGAFVGVMIDEARNADEGKLNAGFAVAGAVVAVIAYACSFLPSERDIFWTSSASFFFLRTGATLVLIAAAYAWLRATGDGWSPLVQLGRHSLFIYWIHVELVYGLISRPLHRTLSFAQVWMAWAAFSALMLACAIVKDRFDARAAMRHQPAASV